MDRFLDLLNTVKKKSNSHFHSCEPELIELMRQIDEMIELKKEEWKGDMESVEAKLHEAHNENRILIKEIQLLKTGLRDEKKSHACTLTQYEKDVKLLKDDMARLKKKYVELQKKIEYTKKKNAKAVSQDEKIDKDKKSDGEANPLNCEIYKNEILILNLKLESLALENGNLRVLMQEQSKRFTERSDYSELAVKPEVAMYRESVEQVSRESSIEVSSHDTASYVFEPNSPESSKENANVLFSDKKNYVFEPDSVANSKENYINAFSNDKKSYVFEPAMPKISEEDCIEPAKSSMFEAPEIVLVTKGDSFDAQPGPSGLRKNRVVRDRRSTIPETLPLLNVSTQNDEQTRQRTNSVRYKFGGDSRETGLEYLDPDITLEDKLNKVLAQFESVSSSMLL